MHSDLPSIRVDKFRIEQVILNLLNNAIDAMNGMDAKILEVTTYVDVREGQKVAKVVFSDSGTGIKPENIDRLFEPFFTTKPDGLGMGLSICRSIIENHGGKIWSVSNPGPGTVFQFILPI